VILVKNFHLYGAWRLLSKFSKKGWKLGTIDKLLKKIRRTGRIDRQLGNGSLQCVMICSRLSLTQLSASGDSDWGRACVCEQGQHFEHLLWACLTYTWIERTYVLIKNCFTLFIHKNNMLLWLN